MKKIRSIVITGATSMLGISLIKKYLSENIEILAIIQPSSRRRSRIPVSPLIKVVECDNSDLLSIDITEKYNLFYHFAWKATAHDRRNDPSYQTINIHDTLDAVKLAAKLGCESFIGAGSQAEYGRINDLISPKTPVNPESAYGVSKYAAGKLSSLLSKNLGLRFIWARVFSVYGPHDGENTMISSTLQAFRNNKNMEFTPSEQIWDYLYEDDCAVAFYLLGLKGKDQQVYNIASGEGHSLKDYISIMAKITDKENLVHIGVKNYSDQQVMFLQGDITLLKQDTGFVPKISFREGIRNIIKYHG